LCFLKYKINLVTFPSGYDITIDVTAAITTNIVGIIYMTFVQVTLAGANDKS
jgi:hypothetical protein